ncbi:DNA-(apurinic or apyrimidinic site) endonuclease 2-like [Arachis stenosperma]|uniref:DNA-(apurinic or apyrimidinic site) endonuclease 2-like n=1 Tax=Arachis stenosperma TaxID=217475 RepID=UPI0025ABC9AC|nr:DNA-(apurinic or apyrimidinic site) endonuclease 2-like [Arachis stenosperma]
MAAQSSTSSHNISSSYGRMLLYFHGEKPVLQISGTKENPGRRFWECVYFEVQQGCNFFRWPVPEIEMEHSEIARIRKKVSILKSRMKAAEWKLKVVAVLGLFR